MKWPCFLFLIYQKQPIRLFKISSLSIDSPIFFTKSIKHRWKKVSWLATKFPAYRELVGALKREETIGLLDLWHYDIFHVGFSFILSPFQYTNNAMQTNSDVILFLGNGQVRPKVEGNRERLFFFSILDWTYFVKLKIKTIPRYTWIPILQTRIFIDVGI